MTEKTSRVSTGVRGLDDILLNGWPANHLYLVEGAPGSGKTTLALQFLIEGARCGERVLYVTLAEPKSESEAVAASHGMSRAGIEIQEYTPTEDPLLSRLVVDSLSEIRILAREALDELCGGGLPKGTATVVKGPAGSGKSTVVTRFAYQAVLQGSKAAISQFDESIATTLARSKALGMDLEPLLVSGRLEFKQCDPAEVPLGEFIAHIRNAVEKQGMRVVAIDTISQSGVVGSRGPEEMELSYLADNVMILSYFEAFGEVKKAISVLKMRMGWYEPSIRELRFENNSFTVGEPLQEFQGILSGVPTYTGTSAVLDGAINAQQHA